MTSTVATVRWSAWYGDRDLALTFPPRWEVESCPPADAPDICAAGIAAAIRRPIGTAPLRDLAQSRRSPCVVIDDLTRPTRGDRLIPPVLDELSAAGIADDDVLILAGVANHRPLLRDDLRKKLGDEVLARCRISNHFSWDNCEPIGTTSAGTPVELNAEFLRSDLRILVGSIIPHGAAGFSGGAKLLMPGIASHASALGYHKGTARQGRYGVAESPARLEAEEAARMAAVDFIVNSVPNSQMGIAGVVAGDVVAAHRAGVAVAQAVFATPTPAGKDVCVLSLYPKDNEFLQHVTAFSPWLSAPQPIAREGGTVVVALAGDEGIGFHSLFGPGMQLSTGRPTTVRGRDLVFFAPGVDRSTLAFEVREGTRLFGSWEDTVAWLRAKHGESASVAVFPCATIQLSDAIC